MIAGMTVIIDETDEKAYQKRDDLLTYGDREGALALFGGWTGIDLSTYSDDEDFRFVKLPAVQSMVQRWSGTVPGSEGLKWTKSRIADYILLGGMSIPCICWRNNSLQRRMLIFLDRIRYHTKDRWRSKDSCR